MPHQCTNCGRAFEDGSKEMLSGCPNCGGNKFQFRPATSDSSDGQSSDPQQSQTRQADSPGSSDTDATAPDTGTSHPTTDASSATADTSTGDGEWPNTPDNVAGTGDSTTPQHGSSGAAESSPPDPEESPTAAAGDSEDTAQASARSDVVSKEELEASASRPQDTGDVTSASRSADAGDAPEPPDADGEVVEAPEATNPDLEELREELNQQFESIKIVAPGQYELNLMGLYDREEYIVSLQEDGRYVIEVPETWQGPGEEEG
jgi:predicted  nucleic acid-binding Zn-ribbon protein